MAGITNPPAGGAVGMVNPMEALAPAVTRRVLPGWMNTDTTTRTTTAGQMHYTPILIPRQISYDRMSLEVISGNAGLARVGLYNFAAGLPTTLLFDAGTIATNSAGFKDIVLAPPQVIPAGYYFIALVTDVTVAMTAMGPESSLSWAPPVAGLTSLSDFMFEFCVLAVLGQGAQVAGGLSAIAVAPTSAEKVDFIHVAMRET